MDDLKMVYTACQGYGCHEHCIISTFVDGEGKVDHTERMVLPEAIQNDPNPYGLGARAYMCQKGAISGKIPYMEERLTHPLKRVGERGKGEFEEISWDQALDEIAEKLGDISEKYGPASILMNDFPCGYAGMPSPLGYNIEKRFMNAFGFSSLEWEGIDMSVIRGPAIVYGDDTRSVYTDTQRVNYADYLIIWGGNPIGYTRAAHTTKSIMDLKDKGVEVDTVGILYDSTAAKSDKFVAVKPASDVALAFSMARYIIESGQADEDFLCRMTVAPLLVNTETGKFLRQSDIDPAGSPDLFAYWDKQACAPRFVQRADYVLGTRDADLGAEAEVAGIACKTAYTLLRERLEPYTFEYQESITGASAEDAKYLADQYLAHENACMWIGAGLRYKNSTAAFRAISLIPMLAGKFENEACGFLIEGTQDSFPVQMGDPICWFMGFEPKPVRLVYMQEVLDSMEDAAWDGQQYKALINLYSNPVHNWPPRELWEERFFPNMELVVVSDIRMCETVMFADYVLPDLTVFERSSIFAQGGYLVYGEPAIEPVGEARDLGVVLSELGCRMGKPEVFDKTPEEWEATRLMTEDPQITTVEPPITIERLKAEKVVKLNDAGRCYHLFKDAPMNTVTGRMEFYSEVLSDLPNGALPDADPALIDDAARREDYPLHLYVGRSRFFMQGQFREIEELRKLSGGGPRVGMNKADAEARGIAEGDLVEVFNERGVVKVPVHFSNFIQPGMAHLWYAYGVQDYKLSGPATTLGAYQNVEEAIDPVAQAWGPFWREWRRGLGMPEAMMMSSGEIANETIWDVLCDVRRAE